jgi:plastocyanin
MDQTGHDPGSGRDPSGRPDGRRRGIALSLLAATALLALAVAPATSASVDATWKAAVGTGGRNGAVTVVALSGGTGRAVLRLRAVPKSATITSVLRAGTCARPGAVVATLPPSRSTSSGTLSLTKSLPAAAVTKLRRASSAIVTIKGAGFSRCGRLAQAAAATPSPSDDSATTDVHAAGFAFTPKSLSAVAGTALRVELFNDDAGVRHGFTVATSVSATPMFAAPIITGASHEKFTIPALPAGTYVFYCPIHPSMTGTLTVSGPGAVASPSASASAAASETPAPTETPADTPPGGGGPPPSYPPYYP